MIPNRISAFLLSLCAIGMMMVPTSVFGQTESELQQKFLRYLDRSMGIEGWIDSDGDIQFEYADRTFFIEVNEGDPEFFRLVLPNIWPIESISERSQVLAAVDVVNRQMKVVKAYTTDSDNVWIAMEVFLEDIDDYEAFLERGLEVIDQAVDTFVEEM